MNSLDDLTMGMRQALRECGYGVRKCKGRFRSIDTDDVVDGRSLEALHQRKLITWESAGACAQYIELLLTPEGEELFEKFLR